MVELSLMDFPLNILVQILSRLPIKSIHTCKCVCKTLNELITSFKPYFIASHSQNATQHDLIIQFGRHPKHLKKSVNLFESQVDTKPGPSAVSPIFDIPKLQLGVSNLALVNGCNGLIYFALKSTERCYNLVCNPITSEYIRVPVVDMERIRHEQTSSSWLGFSASSRKYKVLRIYTCTKSVQVRANIHDVGSSNSWRDIKSNPLDNIDWDNSYAFVNGIGYWLCRYDKQFHPSVANFIVSFDFESEIFGRIKAPPDFNTYRLAYRNWMSIGVVDDCLCLIDNTEKLDIWMMGKDYVWRKKCTCVTEFAKPLYLSKAKLRPLQELRSGEILMVSDDRELVCYDGKRNNFRLIDFFKMKPNFSVVTFVPSFVSLKDILSLMGKKEEIAGTRVDAKQSATSCKL